MSDYLKVEVTQHAWIPIGELDITDFDNLTDEQVLGLFDAYEGWEDHVDEMEIECDEFDRSRYSRQGDVVSQHTLKEKYQDRYDELCEKRSARVKNENERNGESL